MGRGSGRERATLWLVGMMGAGKTSTGRRLAELLALPFHDTDARVEAAAGRSVARIFAEDGEDAFRRLEREAIDELAGRAAVVSLGGGAPVQPGVPDLLAATGRVIYLRARPETLLARVGGGDDRPLLAGLSPCQKLERLAGLLESRRPTYERAELIVETDDRSAEDVARELVRRLQVPR